MKKEYINPEMEVVMIQTMTVLAESSLDVDSDPVSNTESDASQFFDNGGSEEW